MATSPSKRFENGVLVERAIATVVAGDPDEAEAKADRPYKEPAQTFGQEKATGKAVSSDDAENKAVKVARAAKK